MVSSSGYVRGGVVNIWLVGEVGCHVFERNVLECDNNNNKNGRKGVTKLDNPRLATLHSRALILEWYVVCRVAPRMHINETYGAERGLDVCVLKAITTMGSAVDKTRGDLYDHLLSTRIFTLTMNTTIFIHAPIKLQGKRVATSIWICQSHLVLIACFFHVQQKCGIVGGKSTI